MNNLKVNVNKQNHWRRKP